MKIILFFVHIFFIQQVYSFEIGQLTKIIDPETTENEILTLTPYESKGSLSEQKNGLGYITKNWIDGQGRITQLEDPLGRIIQYQYDGLGNLIKTTYPSGSIDEMTYDINGNLLTKSLRGINNNKGVKSFVVLLL